MQRMKQVRARTYRTVFDPARIPEELNKIEAEKREEGYEVSRGGFGIVVVTFPDGELHYVPDGNTIAEIAFKYEGSAK